MKAACCPTEVQNIVLFVLHVQEELLQQQLSKEQSLKERVHMSKYILRQVLSFYFLFLAHFCLKSLCFLLQKSVLRLFLIITQKDATNLRHRKIKGANYLSVT